MCSWVVLKMLDGTIFNLSLSQATSSNTIRELLALWVLLFFSLRKSLTMLHVASDSKLIIDWLNRDCKLQDLNLEGWLKKVQQLKTQFQHFKSQHVQRIFNQEVDDLSKNSLLLPTDRLVVKEVKESQAISKESLDVF